MVKVVDLICTASLALAVVAATATTVRTQGVDPAAALATYDQLLDERVRDGFVYYRALKADRGPLDRYVASLRTAAAPQDREAQIAFWLNAYNAIVLQTVVSGYPIAVRSTSAYPARSIRQLAGAFTRPHRVAGRDLSLDQIEQTVLAPLGDPRVFFALGRGAAGGGRLRSETYKAEVLDRQLREQMADCARRDDCIRVDAANGRVLANQIFEWRRKEFGDAYAQGDSTRPPVERALIAYAGERPIQAERELLASGRFKVEYLPFDWSLNDLATRRP